MKTLLFSDFHLDSYKKWGYSDIDKIPRRLVEQKKVLQQIIDLCYSQGIKRIVFGGDFFNKDKEIDVEVLNIAKWFFDSIYALNVVFVAVRGNHDLSLQEGGTSLHYSLNPFLKETPEYDDLYLGHYDQEHDVTKIKGKKLVVIHNTPIGCNLHGHTFEEGIPWKTLSENNHLVAFGHIHQRQQLTTNTFVIGNTMALDFSDTEDKGCYIIDDYGNMEFITLGYPHFFTLDAKTDDGKRSPDHYFRVIGSDHNSISENEVNVKKPAFFENRIKATSLVDILQEWLKLQGKPHSYLKSIESLLQRASGGLKPISDLILQDISLENFLSFENAHLEVKTGLNLVEGLGGDFSSNGSGKSTLLEAIYWCLFGETTKGLTGDDVIRKYPTKQKDCEVSLTILDINTDKVYGITRSRKGGLSVFDGTLDLTKGMKQKESQEYLEGFLGFNKETYLASTFFSQDSLLLLTKVGVAEKNSLISALLGLGQYDLLQEDVSKIINEVNLNKLELEQNRDNLGVKLGYEKRDSDNLEKRLEEIESKVASINQLGKALKQQVELKESELEDFKSNSTPLDTTVLDQQEVSANHLLKESERILDEFKSIDYQREMDVLNKEINELKSQKRLLEKESDRKHTEMVKFENLKDGQICSYCGSTITEKHKEKYVKGLRHELLEIAEQISKIDYSSQESELNALVNQKRESEIEYKSLTKLSSDLKNDLLRIGKERQALVESSNKVKQEELIIKGLKSELEIYRKQIKEQSLLRVETELKLGEIDKKVEAIHTEILDITKNLEDIVESLKVMDFWRSSFSYSGIKSLLLDNFCNQINIILSEVLMEVSNGAIQCEFSPTTTTKSGESRNKLDLLVYMRGELQHYDSLSGGEKKRVDIAVALSFSKWLRQQYKLSSSLLGILIFDELFDALDASARECILPLLKLEGQDKAIYVISHSNDLGGICDRTIRVKKENKISLLI